MPDATSDAAGRPAIDAPSKVMEPAVGFSSPAMAETVVVLPAPFNPKSTHVSPASMSNEMPCSTGYGP